MDGQKNDKGTSPSGKKPEELTIPELKAWLLSRGAPVKGKKGDLVKRLVLHYNATVQYS